MELGEQLTWLLPVLILICLCCRYISFAFCRFSLKLFLTLLTEAESKRTMLGGFDSLVSFPDKYVPSFLEWTLTTSPRGWLGTALGPCTKVPGAPHHPA